MRRNDRESDQRNSTFVSWSDVTFGPSFCLPASESFSPSLPGGLRLTFGTNMDREEAGLVPHSSEGSGSRPLVKLIRLCCVSLIFPKSPALSQIQCRFPRMLVACSRAGLFVIRTLFRRKHVVVVGNGNNVDR